MLSQSGSGKPCTCIWCMSFLFYYLACFYFAFRYMTHLLPWSGKVGNSWQKTASLLRTSAIFWNNFVPRPRRLLKCHSIRGVTNCLPRSQAKLKVEGLLFEASLRIVLALVRGVSRIKANEFSVHCLNFIRSDNFEDIKSQYQLLLLYGRIKLLYCFFSLITSYSNIFMHC